MESNSQLDVLLHQAIALSRSEDKVAARALMSELAEAGHPIACSLLAEMHRKGVGAAVNVAAANYWYNRLLELAEGRNAVAQWEISECFHWGVGFNQDVVRAKFWRDQAAVAGQPDAQFRLYEYFSHGAEPWGYSKDEVIGMFWLARAVAQEHPEALYSLAGKVLQARHSERPVPVEGTRLLRRSAELGFAPAEEALENFGLAPIPSE